MNAANERAAALIDLGDCHAAMGDDSRAMECYLQASNLSPTQPKPKLAMGMIALRNNDNQNALAHLTAVVQLDHTSAEAYSGLAIVHHRTENFEAAFDSYMKCLELDADNLVALLGLFQMSIKMGTFSKIIHYLEVYLAKHPNDASVLFCLAILQARNKQYDLARRTVLKIIELEPNKKEAHELLRQLDKRA